MFCQRGTAACHRVLASASWIPFRATQQWVPYIQQTYPNKKRTPQKTTTPKTRVCNPINTIKTSPRSKIKVPRPRSGNRIETDLKLTVGLSSRDWRSHTSCMELGFQSPKATDMPLLCGRKIQKRIETSWHPPSPQKKRRHRLGHTGTPFWTAFRLFKGTFEELLGIWILSYTARDFLFVGSQVPHSGPCLLRIRPDLVDSYGASCFRGVFRF